MMMVRPATIQPRAGAVTGISIADAEALYVICAYWP
jgi:hypothetical protein